MADTIAKFIGALRPERPDPAELRQAAHEHPLPVWHRSRLTPEQAQRLGEFALQFLH